jgi:hypothetical protein
MAGEGQQLAAIAAVTVKLDRTLDDLFASVAELKANLGLPAEVAVTEPGPDPPQGALEAVRDLQGAIEGMRADLRAATARLATAEQTAKRLKRLVAGLAISLCLDLLITAGFGWNTVRVNQAEDTSHADQIAACQQGNTARRQDAAVWDIFLGDIAPPKAQTPKIKALLAGIDKRIAIKDTPKNCVKAYGTNGGGK